MFNFLKILNEGGNATTSSNTQRANKEDIEQILAKLVFLPNVEKCLLGSTRLTFLGKQEDSGDIDIAVHVSEKDHILEKIKELFGDPAHITANSVYSFVGVLSNKKVQVDIIFVHSLKWALFAQHASEFSKHKSGVRNELLHSVLKFSPEQDKDLVVFDKDGNLIIRASRSYKLDKGVERIFKFAPDRKDGKGKTKSLVKGTPEQIQAELDKLDNKSKFSKDQDLTQDPDAFASILFGNNVKAKHIMRTEQLIDLIKKHPKRDDIFKDAVRGIKARNFEVPDELKNYDTES